jgi:hypothetical protein
MRKPHQLTIAMATFGVAGCLLLTACNDSTPAAHAKSPAGKPSAGVTHAASDVTADPASTAPTAATVSADAHACALITEKDTGTALGSDPGHGSKFSSHGSSQCQYGNYETGLVLVNLTPTRGRAGYDLMRKNPKLGHTVDVAAVSGVGDRAFEITGPNTASIYFDKGDALVLVMVTIRKATSPPKGQVLALAKTAAGRI